MIVLITLTTKNRYRCCLRLLVLCAVFSFAILNVAAVPLANYRASISSSITNLRMLLDRADGETESQFEYRFTRTLDTIRAELPTNQQIELTSETWTTDNTWLHAALDELQRAPADKRNEKIESLTESLLAIDQRASDLEVAEKVDDNTGWDKERLKGILARPEYVAGAKGPNALTKLIRDLLRWIEGLFPQPKSMEPGRANFVSQVLRIVIVVLGIAVVVYAIIMLVRRFSGPGRKKLFTKKEPRIVLGEKLEPEDTATDLLSEAEALARRGELRAAIRKAYIALLVELGDRKLISLAQYKTNRDYLNSVRNLPQLHPRLKKLTESFERHWYGFAQTTPNDWQDFRAGYREALHSGN